MAEQDLTVAHRDDVAMKNPRVDRRRMLAGEDQLAGIDLIEARYRLAGLKGLPRRIATRRLPRSPAAAIDKELGTGSAILAAETIMVRRPFVAKPGRGGQRRVDSKSRAVGENRLQQRLSVVGASLARWNLSCRFATVRCTRPSSESAEGHTVAAFATHIAEAELTADSRSGSCCATRATTCSSLPLKPSWRRSGTLGRSCGGITACG